MRPEDLITATSAHGVDASRVFEVPGTGPVSWSVADAGMACAGMPRSVYFAMLYSYAGDESCYHELWRTLAARGRELAEQHRWPPVVVPPWIATVVLAEERAPAHFKVVANRPDPRRLALQLPLHTWKRHGSRAYEAVRDEYLVWLDVGTSLMREWLKGRPRIALSGPRR